MCETIQHLPADHVFGVQLTKDTLKAGDLIGYGAKFDAESNSGLTDKVSNTPFANVDESTTLYGISTKDAHRSNVTSKIHIELNADDLNAKSAFLISDIVRLIDN